MRHRPAPWCLGLLTTLLSTAAAAGMIVGQAVDASLCATLASALDAASLAEGRLRFASDVIQPALWRPVTLAGDAPKSTNCSRFEQAQVDLGGDGHPDLVIRSRFCMRGKPSDSLYVFPAGSDVLTRMTWQNLAPLHETNDKIERTGGRYVMAGVSAKLGPAALNDVYTMEVVSLEGKAYVAMSAPPFEWLVLARFKGQGTLEDVCVLRGAG